MATITVLDSTGATQTIAKVTGTGQTTAANSLPVTTATDDVILGALLETAPASDTASSGLNGRLQRVAQRITSLIALTPALGTTTDSAASPVAFTTEGKAQLGAVTETAPGTDTASSGLNGRLQRIAQRLTTLLPVGTTAAASSLGVALATENVAVLGATNETAAASDTATSGHNGLLKRIAQNLTTVNTSISATNLQLPATPSGSSQSTITRPANTTAYTAGDVIGGAITLATGLTSGQRGMLMSIDLQGQIGAIPSGMTTFRLHLYNVTPPSALADNAAFDLSSGDRAAYLGYISITAMVDLGSTIYSQVDSLNRPFALSGSANLFAYLETVGAFTPASNSEVYLLRGHFLGI
jgi:hypothetical protein